MRRLLVTIGIVIVVGLVVGLGGLLFLTRIEGGPQADKVRAIGVALERGRQPDYVAVIAAVRHAEPGPASDAEVASWTLRALADPAAATRPPGTVEDGLRMMEAAALADPAHDAGIIETTFRYGVAAPAGGPVLLPPNLVVADCWARVEAGTAAARGCVALRRHGAG